MSKLTSSTGMFDGAKTPKEYAGALSSMLWDAYYIQAMLRDFCGVANDSEIEVTLSNDGLLGLERLLDHCADLTVKAIDIIPGGSCCKWGMDNE
ncbi:hypothetical protein JMF94_07820 [Desulfovibrio sp. UIB00]|uniref:hypothetical protein n=1 Tax=Desulfovibrio sp. UIB00 TaxID=2804314 RepID=UPI001F113A96|nr:hypothetical protein [Desulfovibrio sp. UIB00]MCH5144990.1 hypothetical protein [Desulfovibrio sp. UIB00]